MFLTVEDLTLISRSLGKDLNELKKFLEEGELSALAPFVGQSPRSLSTTAAASRRGPGVISELILSYERVIKRVLAEEEHCRKLEHKKW